MHKRLPRCTIKELVPPPKNYRYFDQWQSQPFSNKPDSLDLRNAWWLSEVSMLSYDTQDRVEEAFSVAFPGDEKFTLSLSLSSDPGYFVASNKDVVLISFRGTRLNSVYGLVADLATDAKFIPAPDRYAGLVHFGLVEKLSTVWEALSRNLRGLGLTGQSVWFTGHSLGGALANLAAFWATKENLFPVQGIYTFGAPRFGDNVFVGNYEKTGLARRTFRFVNNSDLVTQLPPAGVYRHVGHLVYFDNAGYLHSEEESSDRFGIHDVFSFLNPGLQVLSAIANLPATSELIVPGPLSDHAAINYAVLTWNSL